MPHHKSCKKRIRTSEVDRIRNRAYRSNLRGLIREIREATAQPDAQAKYTEVTSLLDRLTRKGIVKKNRAASVKSRLYRHIKDLPAA
jgi:small subunit ribosomal protein S20